MGRNTRTFISTVLVATLVAVVAAGPATAAWTTKVSGTWTYYLDDGLYRFGYNSVNGQWADWHLKSGWQRLGPLGLSSTLLVNAFNGASQAVDSWTKFRYDAATDVGWYYVKGLWCYRFLYKTGVLQWNYGLSNATPYWKTDQIERYTTGSSTTTWPNATDGRYFGSGMFVNWLSVGTGSSRDVYYSVWSAYSWRTELMWGVFNTGSAGTTLNSYKLYFVNHDGSPPDWDQWNSTLPGTIVVYNYDYQTGTYGGGAGVQSWVRTVNLLTDIYVCRWNIVAFGEHGNANLLGIGTDDVTNSNVASFQTYFEQLRRSLWTTSQIQFYHCLPASSAEGRSMLTSIGTYTGAEVWASDDSTGSAGYGYQGQNYVGADVSDWVLEFCSRDGLGLYNGGTYLTWDRLVFQTVYMYLNEI